MNIKKEFVVKNGYRIIRTRQLSNLIRKTGHSSVALLYHSISDRYLPHISNLYPLKTTRDFIADIEHLLKIYTPVNLHDFITDYNKTISKPVIHFTFDDGLREFYDVVAPVLLNKGIPATCFLNNSFINNNDLFFRYKVSLLIDHILNSYRDKGIRRILKSWRNEYNLEDRSIVKQLLLINYYQQSWLDELASRLGLDFKSFLSEHKPYLTSDQIKELITQGFTFGGHSIDHPLYNLFDSEDQLNQTIESTNRIASEFKLGYKVFSFPFTDNGVSLSFFNTLQEKTDITTFGCAGIKDDIAPKNIQRVRVEGYKTNALNILKGEYLYFCMLKKINKHRIARP